jgi:hypothetical protein
MGANAPVVGDSPGSGNPKLRKPPLLWGRLIGVIALIVSAILITSFGIPVAHGLGRNTADALQAWTGKACTGSAASDNKPYN